MYYMPNVFMPMREIYKHVLIVDDSEPDQLIARKIMQITGLAKDVCVKSTYHSAIEYLKNARKHPEDQPDFIFLDLNLPFMSGLEFLDHVKKQEQLQNIPVIIYSTSSRESDKKRAKELGAFEYLTKPNTMTELKQMLQDVVPMA